MRHPRYRVALLFLLPLLSLSLTLGACSDQGSDPNTETSVESASETGESVSETTIEEPTVEETTAEETVAEETTMEETTVEETTVDYFEANRIELVKPDTTQVADMTVSGDGYDIFRVTDGIGWGYRYGCSYLYHEDGSVDAYFASVGNARDEWDWIAYRHSPDGGKSWEPERVVLTPTTGSLDHFSNCDPGVVYFNGYYYLGYTSTMSPAGACNNVFVARSKNPDGPFEKWNGQGWGGYEPQPILYHDERYTQWGIGEPSFVELNGTLYIYYTHMGDYGDYTMVATADATDENWPATIRYHGVACRKSTDSIDVKYVEEWGKFIGVGTGDRVTPQSWLGVYESNDGLNFRLVDLVRKDTYSHLNNAGISSRPNGHIRLREDADKLCVIYAYGETWGSWNTRVQPITLALSPGNDMNAERRESNISGVQLLDPYIPEKERHIAMIRPDSNVYIYDLSEESFLIRLYTSDTYFEKRYLSVNSDEAAEFIVHDESVITINEKRKATIVGVGTTSVEVRYAGCSYLFHVVITDTPLYGGDGKTPLTFEPVMDTYTIYFGERSAHRPQLRVRCRWDDGSLAEYYVEDSDAFLTFTDYDKSIIGIDNRGVVTALRVGETTVTVTMGQVSCRVRVIVSDDPADGHYTVG